MSAKNIKSSQKIGKKRSFGIGFAGSERRRVKKWELTETD